LEKWLKDNGGKASSQEEAVKITLQVLTGLENLHEKGFVHRDLKPDNILIMNGKYCLADFGISREIKTHSKATGTAGTMEYMPPEAFTKTPSVMPQTDIWAVGVILQKLLTGELPYPQEDYPSLISAILMYEPEPMPEIVPEGLREIVKKALQKDRENRFQTAREMREALKNPPMFLAERAKKARDSETIIDEDFDKTEILKSEPTKNWREIEAEKAKKLAEEQRQRESEIERQKELERQRRQAEEAKRQEEIKRRQTFENSIGMEFVKIPAGSFMMGSDKCDNEKPIHKVTISQDFWLQKTEVTQAQWQAVMGNNPSNFKGNNLPVETVSWDDAQEFIKKLNAKGEGTYRLPTEAEWEYAARAGTTGDYAGNLDSMAWYSANSDMKTHPIGQKQANAWGLYDMHGNVWEWCEDWYDSYPSGTVTDPTGAASGSYRVIRGSCWFGPSRRGSAFGGSRRRYAVEAWLRLGNAALRR
jgi:formylglycine-generating enzyme required for sulfatase activity